METALNNASTAADVALLQAALTAAQEDISAILASNNVYTGALNITNAAELTFATELGSKVAIINGNVTVTVSTANGLTAADVSAVTSKIGSVVGSVTINTNTSLDFSNLSAVSGAYSVTGNDVDDSALASAGDVTLNYDGGYTQPALATAGTIMLTDIATATGTNAKAGTLSVDFSGLTSATDLTTTSSASGTLALSVATSVKVGDVQINSVTATKTTDLNLGFDGTLASLSVTAPAATSVAVAATKISGAATVTPKTTAAVSFPALTATGALTVAAASVEAALLKTASSTISITEAEAITLPALESTTGAFTAADAVSFSAPKLSVSATLALAAAKQIEIASSGTASLTVVGVVTSLKFNNLNAAFDTAGMVKLASLSSNGKSSSTDLTIAGDNALLISASLTGKHGTVIVGSSSAGLAKLTALSTAGTIADLTIQNTTLLAAPSLDHTEDATSGAAISILSNPKLTTFTTAVDKVTSFVVTGNVKLTSFDASSITALPVNSTASSVYTVTVTGNHTGATGTFAAATGLTGAYTAAVSATATAAATDQIFAQNSLLTLKPFLTAIVAAYTPATGVTATASTSSSVSLDYVYGSSATTPAATLASIANADIAAITAE